MSAGLRAAWGILNLPLAISLPWKRTKELLELASGRGETPTGRFWTTRHCYFWHFYALGLPLALVAFSASQSILPACFALHVARRLGESLAFSRARRTSRMAITGYLCGLLFYVLAPLSCLHAPLCCHQPGRNARALLGCAIFAAGFAMQAKGHRELLASAREAKDGEHGDLNRGMFKLATCPHYGAEIVIYVGIAVMAWTVEGVLMLAFTCLNLSVAARARRRRRPRPALLVPKLL